MNIGDNYFDAQVGGMTAGDRIVEDPFFVPVRRLEAMGKFLLLWLTGAGLAWGAGYVCRWYIVWPATDLFYGAALVVVLLQVLGLGWVGRWISRTTGLDWRNLGSVAVSMLLISMWAQALIWLALYVLTWLPLPVFPNPLALMGLVATAIWGLVGLVMIAFVPDKMDEED